MAYTGINKSSLQFNTKLYTGTGSSNAVTGVGFQPDFIWIKNRDNTTPYNHQINDAVRGVNKQLSPNNTNAQETNTGELTAFGSDGFTVGSGGTLNGNGNNIVSWNWKANGQGSANTDGTINTTYTSANTTAGFSIIKYTGSGSAGTVGHGLGVAPDVTIRKKLNTSDDWYVHTTLIDGSLDFLRLNTTANKADSSLTGFTSSTIGVDASSYEEIIYAFKSKSGFSKIGIYEGNGNADGTFVYTGFRPAFLLVRTYSNSPFNWWMFDSKRSPSNVADKSLAANLNEVEASGSSRYLDFTSNGFKTRSTNDNINGSGKGYFYIAFAEAPLVGSNNVPCTAR